MTKQKVAKDEWKKRVKESHKTTRMSTSVEDEAWDRVCRACGCIGDLVGEDDPQRYLHVLDSALLHDADRLFAAVSIANY